ncbi:hypothetical protein ACEWY4_007689 [Coilia grayii]|uniref:DDE-1 domain-containing protein n=1 Tax=Coilia grayii TaxID=363190 RepID=A0ABD1K8X6_9TELE
MSLGFRTSLFRQRSLGKLACHVCAGEKGETTTCLAAFNAEGTYCRTLVIIKGKHIRAEWLSGCPENITVRCFDNGWINSDLFLEWGQMFAQSLPKNDPLPHLLLLDGHSSHVYNLEFIKLLRSKNVHIMCYPPHTTHEMQPADKALFKNLKHHWNVEGRKWTRMMAGQKLSKMEFFVVFSRAWAKAATVENAQAGFRATGMFPLNKNIIPEASYAPSKTTERAPPTTLASTFIRPQSLPLLPTEPVLPPVALTPASLLSEHQTIHPPATPQSPAVELARPELTDLLTPLLPVEPLYFFSDEVEEVLLKEIAEEDTGLFHVFTPQDEAHSPDEGLSTSTSTATDNTWDCPCYDLQETVIGAVNSEADHSQKHRPDVIEVGHCGQWCVVRYDDEPYPGIILEVEEGSVRIKCMHRSSRYDLNKFHWPSPIEDINWYGSDPVMCLMPEPLSASRRIVQLDENILSYIRDQLNL